MPSRKAVRPDDKRISANRKKTKKKPPSRYDLFMAGEITVEDLDDEEIERGQCRSRDGTFRSRPTEKMPRKFYDAMRAEYIRRWQKRVEDDLEPMRQVLRDIATDPKKPADARFKSATFLIERAAGKTPEQSTVKLEVAKWEEDIEELLFDPEE